MKRILTGLIFGLLLVGTILLRNVSLIFFDVFLGTVILIANIEICNALSKRNMQTIKYVSLVHAVLMYVLILLDIKFSFSILNYILYQLYLLLLILFITSVTNFIIVKVQNSKLNKKEKQNNKTLLLSSLKTGLNTFLTCIYPNLILGLLFIVNHFTEFSSEVNINLGLFVLCLVFGISFITDIFAYLVGSVFGGPKLCPTISPKKTISGAIGGIVFTVIASVIAYYIFISIPAYNEFFVNKNITMLTLIVLGIIGSVASQCGDIFASLIKRRSNLKDFGSILPGHGGILDRFDGVIFNTIVIFAYSCIFLI